MKNLIFTIFICIAFSEFTSAGDEHQLMYMSNHQIDSLLTVTSGRDMSITDRMNMFSELFLGMPYDIICSGDGPYALLETQPLVNFRSTNCMVFCEHILALSVSDSWDNFFNNLQQIRYKDGMIGMRTRNHYTMGDWLPENRWLLDDVTRKVGGGVTREVTRTISHLNFFKGKGITDLRYVKPDRIMTIDYIPSGKLEEIGSRLKTGDIGSLIFADKTDIFSAHMWMVAEKEGQMVIRESSNSKMTTFDTPYQEWCVKIAGSKKYIGIAVMRIREELNQPGKIILPWEIAGLKSGLRLKYP